ncbi:MAG: hypothetical protein K9G76_02355 [Bacteroidales bacterium]|nr:hypothetical protein [Bacteroidales bacterium]MCF8404892.1 hypothetical protein [Bacteroidales bacterium]
MTKLLIKSVLLLFCLITYEAFTQIDGDLKSYKLDHFLGFDEVGDTKGKTGDISSVYAKTSGKDWILRITFDNMVQRKENIVVEDHFSGKDLKAEIRLMRPESKQLILQKNISITTLSNKGQNIEFIRTPENNLLEILFVQTAKKANGAELEIKILLDGIVVDEFSSKGKSVNATGNCAFVHHGNQGLTYTEVFYGSPGGLSGLDGSGFDEVLQAHEATGTPGNFHMSGTLMPAAEWHNPEFNDWLETLAGNGLVSMMTSALGQHIMPFMTNDMNDWSVYVESQMVEHYYNYTPRVAWVPERVWLAQGYYPDAGVIDWLGDNWEQHGVWGVVLDDGPHLNGYDNRKIHWMNNGSGVSLRVIPINNTFVGNMHYDADAAKNQIASMGQYHICVYGTDWEVAAEMNEHDGSNFLDNYENVLWYCHDNYPGVNVWKLEDAIQNTDFNGSGANITKGTYGLLGGGDGYGGSNNSWYINWASTPSHSDNHNPKWDYGSVWWDAYTFLTSVNDNSLAQLGWYTMMINLHETGWHSSGSVADWEHRYSSHIKNTNVYTEASRWADGQYLTTTACYFSDIDHDGNDELVIHNDKVFMVFESIGGKANWIFYKNGFGEAFSVVSSDMAYWSETEGDYNESSGNHFAALSEVWPNQQNSLYSISIDKSSGDTVIATLDQWGIQKQISLITGNDYLEVEYDFFNQTGYIKSGWSPDLLNILWSGKGNLQRMWGDNGAYCGYRNASSGATVSLILGNGGASHNGEFEGTLVKGDEIFGYNNFKVRLYAGYTSSPNGTKVPELDLIAAQNMDVIPPEVFSPAALLSSNEALLTFNEWVEITTAEATGNYSLQNFANTYTLLSATRQSDWRKVKLTFQQSFVPGDEGQIMVSNVEDLNGNIIGNSNTAQLSIPNGITPHTIVIDENNDFLQSTELMGSQTHDLFITWDNDNIYIGFQNMDLGADGDLFINIDTDMIPGSGASTGSWASEDFAGNYLPEFQIAIEQGFIEQLNSWNGSSWDYNSFPGNSYVGWSGVGLTELELPWDMLDNPEGFAISVHTSTEDNQIINEVFPAINPTGNHPTITYFYSFFEPFIPGAMPLSAFEPNSAIVVPNTPPEITSFNPIDLNPSVLLGASQYFSLTAVDNENDDLFYTWLLDGNAVSSTDNYLLEPDAGSIGLHTLLAYVEDNVPGNIADTNTWSVEIIESALTINLKVF